MSIKIALPGHDVRTASPEQMSVDSDYDTLKLVLNNTQPNEGQLYVAFSDNPAVGTYNLFQFNHGLNYTPFYYFFFDIATSSKILGTNTGLEFGTTFNNDVFSQQYFQVTDTGSGFIFSFVVASQLADMTNNYFTFRYFVFANTGN